MSTVWREIKIIVAFLLIALFLAGCQEYAPQSHPVTEISYEVENPYKELNGNQPVFTEKEKECTEAFETYSSLDDLGRCGVAFANICPELMPKEKRQEIGQVRPSGWHTVKYQQVIDGLYLYNRCHLIGFQLAGENANEKNLITGTRFLNVMGMLPFEEQVADYVNETKNHVLYRVTPDFSGEELVARGVQMEGYSVEDQGEGICFNVYVYNAQPGIVIDYATGESRVDGQEQKAGEESDRDKRTYVLNQNTKKIHLPDCWSVREMKEKNKKIYKGRMRELIRQGYAPCKRCNP